MFRIIFLVFITLIAEIIIWWAMIRDGSSNWIASHIVHNPWPYAITEMEDGRIIVGNVIEGFEFTVPSGWNVKKGRHPIFYVEENGNEICNMRMEIEEQEDNLEEILRKNNEYYKISVNGSSAIEKIENGQNFSTIVKFILPSEKTLTYYFKADSPNQFKCTSDLEKIKRSFVKHK